MKKIITLLPVFVLFINMTSAQMWNGVDTLYGNEWIEYNQPHFKMLVAEDGMYQVSFQSLIDQGVLPNSISGNQIRLYHLGQEQPIYVSSNGSLGGTDFIEFFGVKNRGNLDEYLFKNPEEEMANPEYSLFTDSSAYFLTWSDSPSNVRFQPTVNDLTNASNPEPFCFYTESEVFSEDRSKRRYGSQNIYYSNFDMAEGFVTSAKLSHIITLPIEYLYSSGPSSILSTRAAVTNVTYLNPNHQQSVNLNGNLLVQDDFENDRVLQHDLEIPSNTLNASAIVRLKGTYNKDRVQVAYVKLKYPRTFDFGGENSFQFTLPASINSSSQYIEISNFGSGNSTPILYDLTNQLRIEGTIDGDKIKIVLPASTSDRNLILVNPSTAISPIENLEEVTFFDYTLIDDDFIIISNKQLSSNQSGTNWVEAYADYRRSNAGRSYKVSVIDVQQLYDQFSYGINRHSISVRNFGHFVKKEWTNPQYVFLIGKGRVYEEIRKEDALNEAITNNTFHIPTFGTRGGGDNLLLSTNNTNYPIIPIGRLAAKTPEEVKIYLEKVIAQESNQNQLPQTIEDRAWRKRLLHLGGGNSNEQNQFRGYLNGFENIIKNSKYGGEVTSFFKTNSDPVQFSISDNLTRIINEGVSLMTIFGHASVGGFDFSIDDAESYDNEGRFPVMLSLGCYSGQIHTSENGVSEDFVLTEKKGAIAFFASTGLSLSTSLNTFGREFYDQLGNIQYGKGIGDVAQETLKKTTNIIGYLAGVMTLHGDPSIQIEVGEGPDYLINHASVKFRPNPISIQLDSFEMSFDVVNIGQRKDKKMLLEIIQELPNGLQHNLVLDSIQAPDFKETVTFKIPTLDNSAIGLNKFYIELDKGNQIIELPDPSAEENNKLINSSGGNGITVHFISNEIIPVFPKKFSIVNSPNLTLKASTSSAFIESQNYIFEIDTTEQFNSPFLQREEIKQIGGVVKWKPDISYQNDKVYYWRVSPEENPDIGGYIWKNSSFLYLAGTDNGWNQSHYFQFKENDYTNVELDSTRIFEFIKDFKEIKIENLAVQPPYIFETIYTVNSDFGSYYKGNPDAGIGVVVFDSLNIIPWQNDLSYGTVSYFPHNLKMFPFPIENIDERANVINFLEDVVPNGYYVIFLTLQEKGFSYKPEEWATDSLVLGKNLFTVLENQGANQIRNLESTGSLPYIFMYQKGEEALGEKLADNIDEIAKLDALLSGNWDEGFFESAQIGPAKNWESLQWQVSSIDNIPSDNYYMDVIGINANGQDSLLYHQVVATDTTLNGINAEEFPFLKLRFNVQDSVHKSAIQLDYWRIFYEGLPDASLNPAAFFSFQNDTLSQGEQLKMRVAIENTGLYNMDSLLVKFTITDQTNNQTEILKRFKPLLQGDTLIANLVHDTYTLADENTIQIEVNPHDDQPEVNLFNNIGFFSFFVEKDKRNPLLDVTFDGVHIMNNDLVSSRPSIMISLNDENPFLTLDDPSLVNIFLRSPYESEDKKIFVDGDTLVFSPATGGGENKAHFIFQPQLNVDGTYYLIVQARDRSGNISGLDYKIGFEVKNKSTITNVLNYPNPFSTSTRFVFTITGSEIPENMKIQIMTISGRIVREIRQDELGPIHVGNNITSFAWDGTDEFGQRLANGVYLYRVVARKTNNEEFEHLNNKSDQFFKNGFGKMVILR